MRDHSFTAHRCSYQVLQYAGRQSPRFPGPVPKIRHRGLGHGSEERRSSKSSTNFRFLAENPSRNADKDDAQQSFLNSVAGITTDPDLDGAEEGQIANVVDAFDDFTDAYGDGV